MRTKAKPGKGRARKVPYDVHALDEISSCEGTVTVEGRPVPVVLPRADYTGDDFDYMEFDRAICEAGVREFVRPVSPGDQPNPSKQISGPPLPADCRLSCPWILVRELHPGVRARLEMDIIPLDPQRN